MIRKLVPILFVGLSLLLSKCSEDENPNYPIEPYIEFRSIQFIETPAIIDPDTIKLIFYFRDGDDDIGLNYDLEHYNFPYHLFEYYLENGSDSLQKFFPNIVENKSNNIFHPHFLAELNPDTSPPNKLVTNNTRKKANYNFLPDIGSNGYCWSNYRKEKFLIPEDLMYLLDENYDDQGLYGTINNRTYRVIEDTLYFSSNENFFNLILEFEQSENNTTWTVFDWNEIFCEPSNPFYSRVPPIQGGKANIKSGPFVIKKRNRWEGTIEYNIYSTGFNPLFGNKSLRLRFKIKDRQLHDSNTITTPIIDWRN
jgi:hypothetical protein